jgi:hypothetical protein
MKICYFDAFSGISGDMTGAGGYGAPAEPLLEAHASRGHEATLLCPLGGRRAPDRMFS